MTVASAAGALALGVLAATPTAPADAAPLPGVTARGNAGLMAPVDLEFAGEFMGWGRGSEGQTTLPAALQGVALSKVVAGSNMTLALTAAGRVVGWGADVARLWDVPADVQSLDVVDIATAGGYAGVVTRSGHVRIWGQPSEVDPTPLDVPDGLTGVKQLVFPGASAALALLEDGSVVGWGWGQEGVTTPPAGLKAKAITGVNLAAYAITEDDTVVGWGTAAGHSLPPETQEIGNVVAVSAVTAPGDQARGMAELADGSLVTWGIAGPELPDVGPDQVVAFASSQGSLVLTEDGVFHPGGSTVGNPPVRTLLTPPAEAQEQAVAQFSVGSAHAAMIVTKMLRAVDPTVAGSPEVGTTLTGTPGTFSADPDQVTSVWLADGQPIPGAEGATLTLTDNLAGKRLSYRSTATKAGEESISSTSPATAPVTMPKPLTPPKVSSTTTVGKVKVAKRAVKIKLKGTVSSGASLAGQAEVTIAKGKKTIVTTSVPVAVDGTFKLTVKKFAKRVAKKTKKAYPGKYRITIAYLGNAGVLPSSGSATVKVKR
ncbi:hypothetical protein [Nocardioides sp. L-11A]|uniref:hypothetical protein n=1 Tax=Nocardioides sp. L-11A TaxID=3043848 RepID=UPI00249CB7E0|nr:hypothetical protein QJ852_05870 [Nocardioides sp. L-11A]